MKYSLALLTILFSGALFAQEADKASTDFSKAPPTEEPKATAKAEISKPKSWYVLGQYSPIDLILPSKTGLIAGLYSEPRHSWELELARASLSVPFVITDLGSMTDTRILFTSRNHLGNGSFSFGWGLSYFDFETKLGSDLLATVSGVPQASVDVLRVQSLGMHAGIANRWVIGNWFTFGIDWISWHQPLVSLRKEAPFLTTNATATDKDKVETALKLIDLVPRITMFKILLGATF